MTGETFDELAAGRSRKRRAPSATPRLARWRGESLMPNHAPTAADDLAPMPSATAVPPATRFRPGHGNRKGAPSSKSAASIARETLERKAARSPLASDLEHFRPPHGPTGSPGGRLSVQ
jgi:hypothetical protein